MSFDWLFELAQNIPGFVQRQQVLTAFGVPLAILIVTAMCKRLVHGKETKIDHFFMGLDAMMAALASGLIYVCEGFFERLNARKIPNLEERAAELDRLFTQVGWGVAYCVFVIAVLFFLLILHQKWEPLKPKEPSRFWSARNLRLFLFSNSLGFATLGMVIYVVNG